MGTSKTLQTSKLNVFKHLSEACTSMQSDFFKKKLGKCMNVIAKIDLPKMSASALKKFDKKAMGLLKTIKSMAEKIDHGGSRNVDSRAVEQQIDETIQKAKEDLQTFAKTSAVKSPEGTETPRANPSDVSWTRTVMQARLGNKIPKNISKNLPEMCRDNFLKRIETLEQDIPREQLENLKLEINSFSSHLLEAAKIIQNDKNYDVRMQIICLDILADDLAIALENKFNPRQSQVEIPPMIAKVGDKFVLQQEVPIENLCLRGGGGKGFGYAGALKGLVNAGKLDQLKAVSGSSAGGIAAVAIGFGTPPQALGAFCDEIQGGVSRKKSKEAMKNYPELENMFSGLGIMGNAAGVIQAIDEATSKNTSNFLKAPNVEEFLQKNPGNVFQPHELKRLQELKVDLSTPREESAMLTFKDLELLGKIRGEGIENNFKALTLTGWDATDGKEIYFNAQNTPNMPIAYATRISMALPGAFKSVEMNLTKYQPGGIQVQSPHKFMDGGLGSNSPNEVFIKPLTTSSTEEERVQHQRAQVSTLSCIFDDAGQGFAGDSGKFSYGESLITGIFLRLLGAIKSMFHMDTLRNDENKKLNDAGNIMVVGHGQLGTLSMSPTEEERNAVDLMSNLMATDWVRQRGEGGVQIESSSLDSLLKQLSLEELRKMEIIGEKELEKMTADEKAIQEAIQGEIQMRKTE
jgi:predicted acylesterase/phospholipase RssA